MRRLPVIQTESPEDAAAASRPVWVWVLAGVGLCFTLWLPLLALAQWLSQALTAALAGGADPDTLARHVATASGAARVQLLLATLVPVMVSLLLACAAGGALVGRFGGRARAAHAGLAGLGCGALIWLLAWLGGGLEDVAVLLALPVLAALTWASAWGGGWIGQRRRRAR